MTNIDIIIPAYNSQDTIIRTLGSIVMQLNRNEIQVTIVNDGGKDYNEIIKIFSPLLNIQEISYQKNMGPGYARQYGIDHTNNEYIIFIDADDTFYEACSVQMMIKPLRDNDKAKFLISPFMQIGKEIGQYMPIDPNLVWVFGHAYKRSFLSNHNIRFPSTRANEDVGFNAMCNLIATHEYGEEGGKMLTIPTYEWHYNEASITRRGKAEYEYGICTPGYIYNCHHAYDIAQREGVTLKELAMPALETAFSCFIYYNVALQQEGLPFETLEAIEELSRKFYYDYYKQIQEYISKDDYKNMYTNSMNSKGNHLQGVIFKMTLDDFIDLMFSKPVNNITYEQIEKNVQQIAEQL